MFKKINMTDYSPWKMWGSYVGAYLLPAFYPTFRQIISPFLKVEFSFLQLILWIPATLLGWGDLWTLLFIPIGFLIGWGIHSLFRRFYD